MINFVLKVRRYLAHMLASKYILFKILCFKRLFQFVKVQNNKIVFVNERYNCNPKAVAEELLFRGSKCRLYWLSDYEIKQIPAEIVLCKKTGIRGAYHLASSKIIVINSKGHTIQFVKKREQFLIQTFHGSLTMKYVEGECEDKLPASYVKNSKKDSALTDLALSNSTWMTNQIRSALWYNGEIFESGFPRNDVLFHFSNEKKEQTLHALGISGSPKIVTYAPTFRDNGDISCYGLNPNLILETLSNKTHDEWIFLVRSHPNLMGKKLPFDFGKKVIDVSLYPDGQEILLVSDLLISDYSSIMMDFLLMRKPILLFVKDEKQYQEIRGLRPEYYKVPFPHCKTNEELVESINSMIFETPYSDDFIAEYGVKDDGHASERVVDRIINEMSLS